MTNAYQDVIDLTIGDPLDEMFDERLTLEQFPALKEFRDRLGHSRLVEVPGPDGGAKIFAKYEFENPFGSVKDRTAYSLLCGAVNANADRLDDLRIVAGSGGNMARALAQLGKLAGIPIKVVLPSSMAESVVEEIRGTGASVEFSRGSELVLGFLKLSKEIADADPRWTMVAQHRDLHNFAVNQFLTGQEIITQLAGRRPSAWVAAVGSGATLGGVARALRTEYGPLDVVAVTPAELPFGTTSPPNETSKFPGAGGLGYGMRQRFVSDLIPGVQHQTVSYPEVLRGMRDFRAATGTAIGGSAAANWITARRLAATRTPDDTVVTLFADSGTAEDWKNASRL